MKCIQKCIILLICIATTALTNSILQKSAPKTHTNAKKTALLWTDSLEQEEQVIWDEFEQQFGITRQQFCDLKKAFYEQYVTWHKKTNTKLIPDEIRALVNDLAHEFNIDPQSFTLVGVDKQASPAYANDVTLFIDIPLFYATSDHMIKKFVIAHELQHIRNQDNSTNFFVKQLLTNAGIDHTDASALINKYKRFQEKRADIQVALKNADWANAYLRFSQDCKEKYQVDIDTTHPTFKERIALAHNIHQQHNMIA